ncbi:ABC transporter permease [Lysinibacillus sp. 54212]|uniref:ABC transporter permease n=1 Tax=Lysinibacillus sp. 54212 TaxID=3119829 RepID=UPI002FC99D56
MFFSLIRKEITLIWRSPQELLILLVMPIALISIIGFALGSLIDGSNVTIEIDVAVVQHEDEEEEFQKFLQEANLIRIDKKTEQGLRNSLPISNLTERLLKDEEIQQFIHVTQIDPSELDQAREKGDYGAIIEIPKGFTKQYLNSLFGEGEKPDFNVYLNENKQLTSTVVKNILDAYQTQFTMMTALASNGFIGDSFQLPTADFTSSVKTINQHEPVSTSAYYTFSMSVMFILYWASTMAGMAFLEKQSHIFDRILLANINPVVYLLSIIVSTVLLALVQMPILFAFAHILFDISYDPWPLYLLVTFMIAVVVGSIAALLSAINYRFNSPEASNVFGSSFVAILAFFGGSFFNLNSFAPMLAKIGNLTPNGAALQSFLTLQQGGGIAEITPHIWTLASLAIIIFSTAFLMFPKRGGIV